MSGSFGSHVGCLYPMSIFKGDRARMEFTGITFAGAGQDLDTGAKVVHAAPNTTSHISTKKHRPRWRRLQLPLLRCGAAQCRGEQVQREL